MDEYQRPEETRSDGRVDRGRSAENARAYAEAGKAVGEALRAEGREVAVCDLWSALMARAGWTGEGVLPGSLKTDKNPAFAELLSDGMYNLFVAGHPVIPPEPQLQPHYPRR